MESNQPKSSVFVIAFMAIMLVCGQSVLAAEMKANPSSSFFVPVHLDTSQQIYSVDIRIKFDASQLKAIGATLDRTILDGRGYQLIQNVGLTGEARFPIYSSGTLLTGSGIVLYVELQPLGDPGDSALLELSRFRCNETDASGGFWVDNAFSTDVDIVVNSLPSAFDQSLETMEDEPITLTLTGEDPDVSDTLSYTLASQPTIGSVVLSETTGRLVYTPDLDISGTDSFTYMVYDGVGFSSPGQITIEILSGNDIPLPQQSSITTQEDVAIDFNLTAIDPEGDSIIYSLETLPEKGTLVLINENTGACQYTPEKDDFGQYYFTFSASDQLGSSEPAQITLIISPINDRPIAIQSSQTLNEDTPFEFQLQATDIDSGTLTYQIQDLPSNGSIEIIDEKTGSLIFTPTPDFFGNDAFTFTVSDGFNTSLPASVQLTIVAVNDAPIGIPQSIQLFEDTPQTFQLQSSDIDSLTLTYAIATPPDQGTLSLNAQSGECLYTPASEFSGQLTFTFNALDDQATSIPAVITLIVDPVNDPPIAETQFLETQEETPLLLTLTAIDIDSDIESFTLDALPGGEITLLDASTGVCQYTPVTDFFGPDVFSFVASDGELSSEPGFITINVIQVNDPPVAESMSITVNEDQIEDIQLNASDVDGDPLTITILSPPTNGELMNYDPETAIIQYKPFTDYYGTDQFTFEVFDGFIKSSSAVVNINVLLINDPPFLESATISVNEDSAVSYSLIAFDEDSPQIIEYQIVQQAAHGEVVMDDPQKGWITYTPEEDFFGTDTFTFTALDDASSAEPAVITIIVHPVNDLPIGYARTFTLDEDAVLSDNLSFDDPDYDMLTITVYTPPNNGVLTITDRTTGAFTYTPAENYFGEDYILFEACDYVACSGPAAMTFIIQSVNDAPVAEPQSITLVEDEAIVITLAATDVENMLSGFEIITQPTGTLELTDSVNGICLYTPEQDFSGMDTFTFQASDESIPSEPATISLTILPINDPPQAIAQSYSLLEDTTVEGILEKTDPDSTDFTLTIVTQPEYGWLTDFDNKTGAFTYQPSSNYSGMDIFNFIVCDQTLCSSETAITLNIQPVNDPPEVSPASFELPEDTELEITLTGMDIENDPLTFEITQMPTMGTVQLLDAATGACLYSPNTNAFGEDSFSYRVFDGEAYAEEAQIQLSIYAVNDTPVGVSQEFEMIEDQTLSGQVTASDVDEDDLIFSIYQSPKKGKLVISESGQGQGNFVYTPYLNANGMDLFLFQVFDGLAYSDPQPVTINIDPVNDAPKANDTMVMVNAGETKELLLNASDAEADPITFVIVQEPEKGEFLLLDAQTGMIQITAFETAQGPDTIIFKVTDGKLFSEEATIDISINPPDNFQPVANPMQLTVTEGIAAYFTLDATDKNDDPLTYSLFQEPTKGTFSFVDDTTGAVVYEPFLNAMGMDRIAYFVNDGIVNSDPAYITLNIQSMPETVVPKQDILAVPVILNEVKSISSLNIQVQCDPAKLEIIGMTLENTILETANYAFNTQIGSDGFASFPISAQGAAITGKGVIAYILFNVLGNEGDITLLEITKLTCNENRVLGGFQLDDGISTKIRLLINELPFAYDGYLIIDEDKSIEYQLIGYDIDMDGPLSYTILTYPEKGNLTLVDADTGKCIFATHPNAYGADEFQFQSYDGKDYSKPATISITILPTNDKPIAFPQSLTVLEDIPKSIQLSADDPADPDDTLIFKIQQRPSNGVAIVDPYDGVCMYQNNEHYFGADSFTYVVDDGIEQSDPATVDIMVLPINDAPVPESFTVTTAEDTQVTFDLKAVDPENDLFEFSLIQEPENGNLTLNSINGKCEYSPNTDYAGTDTFKIQATDTNGAVSSPTTIYLVVSSENDPPMVTSTSFSTLEDEPLSATLTATDIDGSTQFSFVLVPSDETQGEVEINPDGSFTYSPAKDFNGVDIFKVTVSDTIASSAETQISVTVQPANDPPVMDPMTFGTNEDEMLEDTLVASDPDENDEITFEIVQQPENGTLTLNAKGIFQYTPNHNINGVDTFQVKAKDRDNTYSEDTTITINIQPINDPPEVTSSRFTTDEDLPLSDTLEADDPDDNDEITFEIVQQPNKGTLTLNATGSFVYTPALNASGMVTFTVKASDGQLFSEDALIRMTVNPVNDPPVMNPMSFETNEDTPLSGTLEASDPEGNEITFEVVQNPQSGTLTLNATGNFIYTPAVNENGDITFTVKASDEQASSENTMITITILPVNDPPVINPMRFETNEDESISENLQASDPDNNDTITYEVVQNPQSGTLTLNATGSFIYTPAENENGDITFTVKASDEQASSENTMITITVLPVNDPPVMNPMSFETNEDESISENLQATDPDENDTITYEIVQSPQSGTLTLNLTGSFTYTPAENENGEITFTAKAKDNNDTYSGDILMTINIEPVNDSPTANAGGPYSGIERSSILLIGSASDIENDPLTYLWTAPDIEFTNQDSLEATMIAPDIETSEETITVTLTVSDTDSAESISTATVTIFNMASPEISFTANTQTGTVPLNVVFEGTSTNMPESWFWNFGDGQTSTEQNPSHTYESSGIFDVMLTVTGPGGDQTETKTDFIYVHPDVNFTVDPSSGIAPYTATFTPNITGEYDSLQWDFGDGVISTEPTAMHTYNEVGSYTVTLTVTSPTGTHTNENIIKVMGHTIQGTVTGMDTDNPIADCLVEVYMIDTFIQSATTDTNGRYTITNLVASKQYVVGVFPPEENQQYLYQYFQEAQNLLDATYVSTDGVTIVDFSLAPLPKNWLTGQVTDGTNPIENIQVDIYSDRLGLASSATTDSNGVYTLTGLKSASDYRVSVYSSELDKEFFYYSSDMSVSSVSLATPVSPTEEGLTNIDIIVNAIQGEFIAGTVRDSSDQPVASMRVNAWSSTYKAGGNATTNENGQYTILGLIPVDSDSAALSGYVVEIQPDGYMYSIFNNGETIATNRNDINFILSDTANISGRITNTSNPVADATVQIYAQGDPSGIQEETQTDENGAYDFQDLPIRNDYILFVNASGFPRHYYISATELENASLISLEMGSVDNINLSIDKGLIIKGLIYYADQTPAFPVTVTLQSETQDIVKTTETNSDGTYEFTGLDGGISDYILSVVTDNYLPSVSEETLIATDAADAEDYTLSLVKGNTLTGLISYEGEPVSDAMVNIQSDTGRWSTKSTGDMSINYTLTGLPADTYQIEVKTNAYQKESHEITISADTPRNFALSEEPPRTIQGTITNLEKDSQIQLIVQSQSKDVQKSVTIVGTGESYAYSIEGLLPASDYLLEFKSDDYANQYYDAAYLSDNATLLDLTDEDATGVNIVIETNLSTIQGTLDFPDSAADGDKVRLEVKSDSTGFESFTEVVFDSQADEPVEYSISGLLLLDDYIMQLRSDTYLNRYWDESDKGTAYAEQAVKINTSSGSATVDFVLDAGYYLAGTVKNANDEPLEGIQIDIWSDSKKVAAIAHTSSDGSYLVKGLDTADDYQIKATTSTNAKFYYNDSQSVQIPDQASTISTSDGSIDGLDIKITKGETISGKIRGSGGQALSGIWVNAWSDTIGVGSGVFSDDDGAYEILDLPKATDYVVSAKPEWNMPYNSSEQSNIEAPSTLDMVLSDKSGYTVRGTITDQSGSPVKNAVVQIQSESNSEHMGWAETGSDGTYTIDLLPQGNDYDFQVKPPEGSSHAFLREAIGKIDDALTKNAQLEIGYVFSGTVSANDPRDGTQDVLADATVTVWSEKTRFFGESVTNSKGEYEIQNVPMAADYELAVKADDYLELQQINQAPKTDASLVLQNAGLISGIVRSSITGKVVPDASIEIYSQANQGLDVYNGVASTNSEGYYAVSGLKPLDNQGNGIKDFVVTVYATGFPPIAKTGKQLGDTVSFDLTKGPENEISGTVTGTTQSVAIDVYEILQDENEFVKTTMVNSDYTFLIDGLRSDGQFLLKFVTLKDDSEYAEWAQTLDGEGTSYSESAMVFTTESTITFKFSGLKKRKRYFASKGPGPVRNLKSLSHDFKSMNTRLRAADESGPDRPSSDANVTVAWDPPAEGSANVSGYYHFFDTSVSKKINKFSVEDKPPIRTRKITSKDLEGDDVKYYFHVATVDKEGRIGQTTSIAFRIDTTPPTNVNVTAPTFSDRLGIGLTLGATGASEMYISNLGYEEGGQWESQSVERTWRLTDGSGNKNIYARFRDKAGNEAKAAAITLYAPSYSIEIAAGLNGKLEPSGSTKITHGNDLLIQFIPDTNYIVDQVLINNDLLDDDKLEGDDQSLDAIKSYVLKDIQRDYQVKATFKRAVEIENTYTTEGDAVTFTMTGHTKYELTPTTLGTLTSAGVDVWQFEPASDAKGILGIIFEGSQGQDDTIVSIYVGIPECHAFGYEDDEAVDIRKGLWQFFDVALEDIKIESYPTSGTISNGNYSSLPDFYGKDSFTFTSQSHIEPQTFFIIIDEVNDSPVIINVPESIDVVEDTPMTILFTVNDVDNDIDQLNYYIEADGFTDEPFASNSETLTFSYTPLANSTDPDTIKITVDDGEFTVTTTINVVITPVNDAPVAFDQTVKMNEDTECTIILKGQDPDDTSLTFTIQSGPKNGITKIESQSDSLIVNYKPIANYNGKDSFVYTVSDGKATSNEYTVTILIKNVNDIPISESGFIDMAESGYTQTATVRGQLTAWDNEYDNDTFIYVIQSNAKKGMAVINNPTTGEFTYQANNYETGMDYFSFKVYDGYSDSNTATMMINISEASYTLTHLKITLQEDYTDNDDYYYLIRNITDGQVVSAANANTQEISLQLTSGQYRLIIQSSNYDMFESDIITIAPEQTDVTIPVKLTKNPQPELSQYDISHTLLSDGFMLYVIPNQYGEPLLSIVNNTGDETAMLSIDDVSSTYHWQVESASLTPNTNENHAYTNTAYTYTYMDTLLTGDISYTIVIHIRSDNAPSNEYSVYTVNYIDYADPTHSESNKTEEQKIFESTYGETESITFSEKEFYPLLGTVIKIKLKDNTDGRDRTLPVTIPSLPLQCLFIDDDQNRMNYDATTDYYDIQYTSTLTPESRLIAKVNYYSFGKDSVGSAVELSFFDAETGYPVRYNPIYNHGGQRVESKVNEAAPVIELPLVLNPESDGYIAIQNTLMQSDPLAIFFNEKGDGQDGFKQNMLDYRLDSRKENVVFLKTNHLTGIGFAVGTSTSDDCKDCDDNSGCFIDHFSQVNIFWILIVFAGLFVVYEGILNTSLRQRLQ